MNKQIILNTIVTEKAMKASEAGKYSFLVAKDASKTAIKLAVASMFNVNVVSVQTSIVKGRTKRVGTRRIETDIADWKKAMVKVKKGEKIGIFEPGGDGGEVVKDEKVKDKKKK